MRVRVLFFGRLKEISGLAEDNVEMSEGARVDDLFARYANRFPELAKFRHSVAASINQQYAEWNALLTAGDEVAFLPPVSGGQGTGAEVSAPRDICEIMRTPLRPAGFAHTPAER